MSLSIEQSRVGWAVIARPMLMRSDNKAQEKTELPKSKVCKSCGRTFKRRNGEKPNAWMKRKNCKPGCNVARHDIDNDQLVRLYQEQVMTYEEISKELGISAYTARKRVMELVKNPRSASLAMKMRSMTTEERIKFMQEEQK